MKNMWILAQADAQDATDAITSEPISEEGEAITTTPGDPNTATGGKKPSGLLDNPINLILIAVMVFFVFMMFRGPRKKQQEHRKMVQSLQKNDRVRTIGGLFGTIVEMRDDEIILKIDESNNTKIKIAPSAIGTKVADEKS